MKDLDKKFDQIANRIQRSENLTKTAKTMFGADEWYLDGLTLKQTDAGYVKTIKSDHGWSVRQKTRNWGCEYEFNNTNVNEFMKIRVAPVDKIFFTEG